MNKKRITILIGALAVSMLILWHDLPIEHPMTVFKVIMLFWKLFAVLAVTSLAYVFAGGKEQPS